jgi:chondroitin 4-sulfotransferase 11
MTIHFHSVPATFRPIRRNSTTSFKFWARAHMPDAELLFEEFSDGGLKHMTVKELKAKWPNPGTTFGFVRNPYSRIVSGFHWLGQQAKRRILQRQYNKDANEYPFPLELDLKLVFYYNKGFDWWIKNTVDLDIPNLNPYGTLALFENPKQTQMFCFDHQLPDIVIKLENMDTEFVKIQRLLDCNAPPFFMNASQHDDYRQYYTTETEKIVRSWVEEDLDTFGYTL